VHTTTIYAVNIAEFVNDRIALTVPTGGRTHIIGLDAQKPTKSDSTGSFCGELRQALATARKIHRFFYAELGTEDKLIADTGDCAV
jgi:hypothetical protein